MCGIVGYIGERDATPLILNGLKKLEYRGYDSTGLAVLEGGQISVRRDAGKLDQLEALVTEHPTRGSVGIGHTRWATHGVPNQQNAHPHLGSTGKIVIVHNGIVENFLALKEELSADGVVFKSDTDTESIAHLIEKYYAVEKDLFRAVCLTLKRLKGAHGLVVMSPWEPDHLIAARLGNAGGIALGLGDGEMFIASDVPAIIEHTRDLVFLDSGQIATVRRDGFTIETLEGAPVHARIETVDWDPVAAEKGNYRHFMQKEIHEQPRALADTLIGRVDFEDYRIVLPELNLDRGKALRIEKIFFTACGTAAYAAMVGKLMVERIARIPCEVMIASEFRYADPVLSPNTVLLAISQSGETADTLAAMEEGRKQGVTLWSIVNAIGTQAMRMADGCLSMQIGPEIGVASTKAFTAPLLDMYMLAVYLADLRGTLPKVRRTELVKDLLTIPALVEVPLAREEEVRQIASRYLDIPGALYIGRGLNMPIAYEGALKLKEISYKHAEGYPAGELKHGPIALIDEHFPVVAIAPQDAWYDKMISQIEQVKARRGRILAVATEGDELISTLADDVLWVPPTPWLLSPVLTTLPLQMFAYHLADQLGLDVDQPRNLAKSVTVE